MAIDIASLRPLDAFLHDMQTMIASWKSSEPQDGVAGIMFPGEPEYRHQCAAHTTGIALPADLVSDLVSQAANLGIVTSTKDLAF
jgi:LDH2 family malate/lactate/ureidoglycolate dehydrogenase